jgi:hypothetical protein
MARLILIQEDDYEMQYQESINYLNSKYHDQPSRLKNIPLSESETLALSTHGAFGRNQQQGSISYRNTPLGKLVI